MCEKEENTYLAKWALNPFYGSCYLGVCVELVAHYWSNPARILMGFGLHLRIAANSYLVSENRLPHGPYE